MPVCAGVSLSASQLEGEHVTLATCPSSLVLRVPGQLFREIVSSLSQLTVLYGPAESIDESAVITILKSVLKSEVSNRHDAHFAHIVQPSSQSDYEKRYPTLTDDIADVLVQVQRNKLGL